MAARTKTVDRSDSRYDETAPSRREPGCANMQLTADDLHSINAAASKIEVQGARLPEAVLKMTER